MPRRVLTRPDRPLWCFRCDRGPEPDQEHRDCPSCGTSMVRVLGHIDLSPNQEEIHDE